MKATGFKSLRIMLFLEILQNSQENTCARDSILIKCRPQACNFIKINTLAQVVSCEFCEISKNSFSTEHVWATASLHCYEVTLVKKFNKPLLQKSEIKIFD